MTDDASTLMDRRQMIVSTAGVATTLLLAPAVSISADTALIEKPGRHQPFDRNWLFRRGEGQGFESPDWDDASWRVIDLPHDWSMEDLPTPEADHQSRVVGPFDRDSKGGSATGFTLGGEGWYRKHFRLPPPARGRVEILFEGVYMNSDVWLNGHHLGSHPYGYTPFAYDLTPYLAANGFNVLAVRVRNMGQSSRWYSGSGIYRHVWLDVFPERTRLARWGIAVLTRKIEGDRAHVAISTQLDDRSEGSVVVSRIRDAHGRVVKEMSTPARNLVVEQEAVIGSARLWSPDDPALYTLETELRRGRLVLDRQATSFGIRIVSFDADRGMAVNGKPTKLRGGCIHHDNGLLGSAAFDVAEHRKVRLLKERGFNAVRPSHNPFSEAFLDACDRYGVMALGESFDAWHRPKLPDDYSVHFDAHWREDLRSLVLSARNHASIIAWSIGNEIPGRNSPSGIETQWLLANEVHRLDPTRPVTAAINGFAGRSVTPAVKSIRPGIAVTPDRTSVLFLDIVGYNYKLASYQDDHQQFPQRIFFGSESFPKDVAAIWALIERSPWLLGDFVWTALDYLGEAGAGGSALLPAKGGEEPMAPLAAWPWVNAYCGDLDLLGQQKAPSLARDVVWGLSTLEMTVRRPVPEGKVEVIRPWGWHDELQSWTWPDSEGKPLTVCTYTAGDQVELMLNGRSVESKSVAEADLKCVLFTVPYVPGKLEAVAYQNGKEVGRRQLQTASAPAAIRLKLEPLDASGGLADVGYVSVEIIDAQGQLVPDAAHTVELTVTGSAQLIGYGSASPFAIGSFQSQTAQTWKGRALAIVRAKGQTGRVVIEAHSDTLRAASLAFSWHAAPGSAPFSREST